MAAPLLIPVLGDQLTTDIASLRDAEPRTSVVLMMEVADETTYVRHHKAKIAFILSAMRHHAERLRHDGWTVDYVRLGDPARDLLIAPPIRFHPGAITCDVLQMVAQRFANHIGSLDHFHFGVTKTEALKQQTHFLDEALLHFGDGRDDAGRAVPVALDPVSLYQRRTARTAGAMSGSRKTVSSRAVPRQLGLSS